jgi:hypothetical protein
VRSTNLAYLCLMGLFAEPVFSQVNPSYQSGKAASMFYRFDMDFFYLTELKGFSSSRNNDPQKPSIIETPAEPSQSGTFGLGKSVIELDWFLPRGTGVEIVLRPDAVKYSGQMSEPVELDTRSGRVAEELPSIHFLDEYRLVFKKASVESHLGVERSILQDFSVAPNILGFGLRVLGPMKSFAMGLSLPQAFKIGDNASGRSQEFSFGADVLSGRDDRHDGRVGVVAEVGETPAKNEPYWGAALKLDGRVGYDLRFGVTAAGAEERASGGRRYLQWYQAGLRRDVVAEGNSKLLLAMEIRQLRETYDNPLTKISDVSLTSVGITSAFYWSESQAAFAGIWLATGDIHLDSTLSSSRTTRAMQFDFGWKWLIEDQIEFVTALSREWRRDGQDGGGTTGGFRHGSSNRSAQSRFALQLNYRIGGQM